MSQWVNICSIDDILLVIGVCVLFGQQQVVIFCFYYDDRVFVISNIDLFFNVSVLFCGIIVEYDGVLWVVSLLKKQCFCLSDGLCMEDVSYFIVCFDVCVKDGYVQFKV